MNNYPASIDFDVMTQLLSQVEYDQEQTYPEAGFSRSIREELPQFFDEDTGCFSARIYSQLKAKGIEPFFKVKFKTVKLCGVRVRGPITKIGGPKDFSLWLSPTPIPRRLYQIRRGDSLIGLAHAAYGKTPGFWGAQYINCHPYNRRFWRSSLRHWKYWPRGRISFGRRFGGTSPVDHVTAVVPVGGAPRGSVYPIIWIPPARWKIIFVTRTGTPCSKVRKTVETEVEFDVRKGKLDVIKIFS